MFDRLEFKHCLMSLLGLLVNRISLVNPMENENFRKKTDNLISSLKAQKSALPAKNNGVVGKLVRLFFVSSQYLGSANVQLAKSSITRAYLFFKLWNVMNAVFQLYAANRFIAPKNFSFWSLEFANAWFDNHAWKKNGHFPRVVFCDVAIREIAEKPITYTVQCVLR